MKSNQPALSIAIHERIEILDVIRGFALFGIFTINIASFTPGGPPGFVASGDVLNNWLTQLLLLLVESKFFTLFSFLFGLGFAIQMIRAEQRGNRIIPQFSRRMLGLAVIGFLHIILLWDGDILLLYAMVGILLLMFRKLKKSTLLRWALLLLGCMTLLVTFCLISVTALRLFTSFDATLAQADASFIEMFREGQQESIGVISKGTFFQLANERLQSYIDVFPLLLSRIPTVLGMFLLGLYTGKTGIVQNVDKYMPLFRKIAKWGLGIGIPLNVITLLFFHYTPAITGVLFLFYNQTLMGPLISLGLASSLVLLCRHSRWGRILAPLAYPGRMALTNYVCQSVVYSILFYGYGLGLYGQVQTWQALLIAIVVYVLQIGISRWWLQRFRMGPLERVWRSVTYSRIQ
ncbi:DUF418 domain-containing protein [Paenibacillus roseipurpureus]|uniref:DUF418 domain-containing protein n=1 Tax=Paenibacillus roseopurpureus TaxID=2918901 RepID=A0AA96RK24_9BACL|nr:DUF418 domain-containing protein [Paenibacillus sp. MBLB1832]WNR45993.1 DUF418 domain-containing protein [Paenibacillus sp. MBLB1832]